MRQLRDRRFWAGCLAGWATLMVTESTTIHLDAVRAGRPSSLGRLMFDRGISDLVWPVIAAIVFARMARLMARHEDTRVTARTIAVPFAWLALALAPLYLSWGCFIRTLVHAGADYPGYFVNELRHVAGATYLWSAFLYTMITLAASTVLVSQRSRRHERDSIELKARLASAELELLRAQLEPHFLFNALNTIAAMVRTQRPDLATNALAKLSELLRYVVEASRQDRVPLAWELEFATSYLELQQMRYGPRMQFEIHHAAAGRSCDVPPLLLQPLIENAVVHGVARTSEAATIDVQITASEGALRVEIGNTRGDRATPARASTGVGLRNTRERLTRMYGDDFVLDAGPEGADRYRVSIALPHVVDA